MDMFDFGKGPRGGDWPRAPYRRAGRLGCGPASPEPAAIQRDQPFPMPFRRRLVVAPALGKGETVMGAGINLDLARGPGPGEQAAQFLDHRQRRELVMFGA